MLTLFHYPLSMPSRLVRLAFGEYAEEVALVDEKPWARRKEFLAVNPANILPLLLAEGDQPIVGAGVIIEYLDETRAPLSRGDMLFPSGPLQRAETRRLMQWYLDKANAEVVNPLVRERVFKLQMTVDEGGGSPDTKAMRQARANLVLHMRYTNWLAGSRNWLGGDARTYADLAGAAALSVLDYLGEIQWAEYPAAKDWYARMKSRPSFRGLLADRVRSLAPASHYTDLDF
jgi:glutathione S-transferase